MGDGGDSVSEVEVLQGQPNSASAGLARGLTYLVPQASEPMIPLDPLGAATPSRRAAAGGRVGNLGEYSSLYLHATSKEEYSILVLGLDGAGKTTFLEQIKALYNAHHEPNLKTVPTVGQNVSLIDLPDCYLKVWDVGGQHSLRGLWQSYYSSAHAIVFVVDSTDIGDADVNKLNASSASSPTAGQEEEGRLGECKLVLEDVLENEETEGVPVLVLANKQDREDCVEVVKIKEGLVRKVFEGERGSNVRDSRVLPMSALSGTGVREAVEWLCSRVRWNKEGRPPVMR
ncbi:hypothetical protein D0860_05873 [Hortaea werneckii]|uniref:Uncharacterized protein n=1 Tax=Hortaea werneckii TaxID=91943 RepID=A0A3M7GWU2_HORWE|nr:hypothetical protein D0860_05873 [Hortaea werneckii]RMZ31479.1 hypothetical protein D0859_04410 [Hortaea werneckii]